MKKTKEQGITLVALVITIIVLLILAGVALAALFGNSSIIDNANYAVTEYNKSADADQNVITSVEGLFAKYMGGDVGDDDDNDDDDDDEVIPPELQEQYGNLVKPSDVINQDLFTYTVSDANHTATVIGINWDYFVSEDVPSEWDESTYITPFELENTREAWGNTYYTYSVNTWEKATEIASTLRKLIVPYEVTINDTTYSVTNMNITKLINFSGYILPWESGNGNYYPPFAAGSSDFSSKCGSSDEDESYLIIPNSVETVAGLNSRFIQRDNIIFASNSKVTVFPDNLFSLQVVSNIVFPPTLTSIGSGAFYCCTELTSLTIPEGVTTIGSTAFQTCRNLSTLNLPSTLRTIGDCVFLTCNSLTTLNIPDGVTSLGELTADDPYGDSSALVTVHLPANLTTLQSRVFAESVALRNIEWPTNLTTIGEEAFDGSGIRNIVLPDTVTKIDSNAFRDCEYLQTVQLPNNLSFIGYSAFENCSSLKSVTYKGTTYYKVADLVTALRANNTVTSYVAEWSDPWDDEDGSFIFYGVSLRDD